MQEILLSLKTSWYGNDDDSKIVFLAVTEAVSQGSTTTQIHLKIPIFHWIIMAF